MIAAIQNITMEQSATFQMTVALNDANNNPLDTSPYSSLGTMRRDYQSTNSFSFSTALSNGSLIVSMSANSTSLVPAGRYVYDVYLIDTNGVVVRVIEGLCNVTPEVSNPFNTDFPVSS